MYDLIEFINKITTRGVNGNFVTYMESKKEETRYSPKGQGGEDTTCPFEPWSGVRIFSWKKR